MPDFNVEKNDLGRSLLDFLLQRIPAAPAAYLKQLIKKKKVQGAAGALNEDYQLQAAETISLPESQRILELLAVPMVVTRPLEILYETREILVVDKPAGLAVHSSQGHEEHNLTARLVALLKERGQRFIIAPVHRLDVDTSGPVLFGKGKQACASLGKLFIRQEVEKYYLALVAGKTAGDGRLESILSAKGKEKQARTDFHALARNEQASLLELQLYTGRQHQIRRQLADQGHPLFGDTRYHGPCPAALQRMFLHCSRLAFIDPFSAAPISVESPLPGELTDFLPQVGITL